MRRTLAHVLFTVLCACGDGVSLPADGATGDDDAGAPPIHVRYVQLPEVRSTATVFFQSSGKVYVTHTDGAGEANARMTRDTDVTVYVTRASSHFAYTYMGVHPGEEVVVDDRGPQDAFSFRHFYIQVPAVPDGSFYNLETSCGAENISTAINDPVLVGVAGNLIDCPDKLDLLVNGFGSGRSYFFYPQLPVIENGTIHIPDQPYPYRPLDRVAIDVVGADEVEGGSLQLVMGPLTGQRMASQVSSNGLFVTNGETAASLEIPAPPNASEMYDLVPIVPDLGTPHLVTWGPATTSVTLDLARDMPRDYLTVPTYDPATNTIAWTEAPGRLADVVFAVIAWQADGLNYQWQIQAPRGEAPLLELPTLPDPTFYPQENILPVVSLVNLATDRGIAGVGLHLLGSWFPGSQWPAETASGDVRWREIGALP